MSIDYSYIGHNSLNLLSVGSGRGAWRKWQLMDHEGPYFQLDYLGLPEKRYSYLPAFLLELLYERFRRANPLGVSLGSVEDVYEIAKGRYSPAELDALHDQRKAMVTLNSDEAPEGYPHMRPYLPELFERETIELLASDPWLDVELLRHAETIGAKNGGIPPDLWVERSARWSPEWRAYCDKLN